MKDKRQMELIHTRNTWMNFIGGYYKSTDDFITEAKVKRISRRAPAQTIRGMQFGDCLVLLRYHSKGIVSAFAEAQIVGLTLDHDVADEVRKRLRDEGKAEYSEPSGGGSVMTRECCSYIVYDSWTVTCSLSEVMDIALDVAKQKDVKLFCMVNAELTNVYTSPVFLQPAPSFTRGFIKRAEPEYFIAPPQNVSATTVLAISNYAKA